MTAGRRTVAQNEIDLARALRHILTGHDLTPDEMRAQVRLAAALSVRQGDVIGELTGGVLRASPNPAALIVLAELRADGNAVVDRSVASHVA